MATAVKCLPFDWDWAPVRLKSQQSENWPTWLPPAPAWLWMTYHVLSCRERQFDHQIARLHLADRIGFLAPDELTALEPRDAAATINRVNLIGHRITEIAQLPFQLRPPLPDEAMNLVGAGARMPVDGATLVMSVAPLAVGGPGFRNGRLPEETSGPSELGVLVADGRGPGGGGRRGGDQNESNGDELRQLTSPRELASEQCGPRLTDRGQ